MLLCCQFKIGFEEMLTRTLWLAMWNHDTFGHNDFLGEVMLPLETYQESGFSWDDPSPYWYPLHERVIHCMHLCYQPFHACERDIIVSLASFPAYIISHSMLLDSV